MEKSPDSHEGSMHNILSGLNDDAESKILARDNIEPNELKALLEMTEDELYEAKNKIEAMKKEKELLKQEMEKLENAKNNLAMRLDSANGLFDSHIEEWTNLLEEIKKHMTICGKFFIAESANDEHLQELIDKYSQLGQAAIEMVPKGQTKLLQKEADELAKDKNKTLDKTNEQLEAIASLKSDNESLLKRLIDLLYGLMNRMREIKEGQFISNEKQLRDELIKAKLENEKKQQQIDQLIKNNERLNVDLENAYMRAINNAPDGLKNNVKKLIELQKKSDSLQRENLELKDSIALFSKDKEEFEVKIPALNILLSITRNKKLLC